MGSGTESVCHGDKKRKLGQDRDDERRKGGTVVCLEEMILVGLGLFQGGNHEEGMAGRKERERQRRKRVMRAYKRQGER